MTDKNIEKYGFRLILIAMVALAVLKHEGYIDIDWPLISLPWVAPAILMGILMLLSKSMLKITNSPLLNRITVILHLVLFAPFRYFDDWFNGWDGY